MIFYGKPDNPESIKSLFQETVLERELLNKVEILNKGEGFLDYLFNGQVCYPKIVFTDFEIIESKINEANK